MDVLIPTKEPK